MTVILKMFFEGYYFLRERLPFFIYFIYLYYNKHYDKNKNVSHIELLICLSLFIIGGILGISLIGLFTGLSFYDLFGFRWQYSGIITWSIFFFIYFIGIYYKTDNTLKAFTISILASASGGWVYEISFWHPLDMFFLGQAIFYIKGQIICFILLIYEYMKLNVNRNKINVFFFMVYLIFTLLTIDKGIKIYPKPYNWFYRLPTALFFISLISGIEMK